MKLFITMLLIANLLGWAWVGWQERASAEAPSKVPSFAFQAVKNQLQLLDTASASERIAPSSQERNGGESAAQASLPFQGDARSVVTELAESKPWCGLSDVFQSEEEANSWLSKWVEAGGQGHAEQIDELVSSTWWVHLPPFQTEADARNVLVELKRKEIDSFYMRTGELAGGISLGVFSRKESAYLWQAALQEKGYSPAVKEIPRMAKHFKVAIELQSSSLLSMPKVAGLLSNQGSTAVHEIPCK